jgi:folate-binding protein YgfZ
MFFEIFRRAHGLPVGDPIFLLCEAMTLSSLEDNDAGKARHSGAYNASEMPEFFTDPEDEFRALVSGAAIIDSSSYGRIEVSGADRLDLLHRLSTNDLLGLRPSQVAGTIFTTDKGRVVDLVFVAVLDSTLLLIVSPNNEERIIRWVQKYSILEDITLRRLTEETAMVSFVGTRALEAFGASGGTIGGVNSCSTRGLRGRPLLAVGIQATRWQAVHVVGSRAAVLEARIELTKKGDGKSLAPAGSRAYEWYRIATGMPALQKELSESFNPYDIGLIEFVNFRKGCYIGQEVIARLHTYQKAARGLAGLVFRQLPEGAATGTPILREQKEIGRVTSLAPDVIDGRYLGVGVVGNEEIQRGATVQVAGGTATLRSLPMFPPYS